MSIHQMNFYSELSEAEIRDRMSREGFSPRRVAELPGAIYEPHKNPTDMLLVFIAGSADVTIGDKTYHCRAGDRLEIPGHIKHSALIGEQGVVYLMTCKEMMAD